MKKSFFLGVGVAGLFLAGCSDSEVAQPPALAPAAAPADMGAPTASAPVTAPPPASAPGTSASAVTPPPGTSATPVNTGPGLLENVDKDYVHHLVNINNAYQDFRSIEMRSPRDLNELLTAKRLDKLPPAPPGKQYKIDEANLRIILVNQ